MRVEQDKVLSMGHTFVPKLKYKFKDGRIHKWLTLFTLKLNLPTVKEGY